jgi:hypothetical protein
VSAVSTDSGGTAKHKASISELLTALVLCLVGAGGIYLSLELDRPGHWFTAPGIVPLFVSAGLVVMSAAIAVDTVRRGALGSRATIGFRFGDISQAVRFLFATVATGVFYFVLLRYLPFEIACAIFLFVMFRMFWRGATWLRQALAAIATSCAMVLGFQLLLDVPIPGENNILDAILFQLRWR